MKITNRLLIFVVILVSGCGFLKIRIFPSTNRKSQSHNLKSPRQFVRYHFSDPERGYAAPYAVPLVSNDEPQGTVPSLTTPPSPPPPPPPSTNMIPPPLLVVKEESSLRTNVQQQLDLCDSQLLKITMKIDNFEERILDNTTSVEDIAFLKERLKAAEKKELELRTVQLTLLAKLPESQTPTSVTSFPPLSTATLLPPRLPLPLPQATTATPVSQGCASFIKSTGLAWYQQHYNIDDFYTDALRSIIGCSSLNPLSAEISVIELKKEISRFKIAKKCLYVRKFYPKLLSTLREQNQAILIGNPGTGKSMFFYYYLARICNIDMFGELPPDSNGKTAQPEVILYQLGSENIIVFFIKEKVAHEMPKERIVLRLFDPKTTIYIFEPDMDISTPIWTDIPTLLLVSPDDRRYKEFNKAGGVMSFMPCYTESELLTIGRHMKQQPDFPPELVTLYTDDLLLDRYRKFGGIIRHVCITYPKQSDVISLKQSEAISNCEVKKLLSSSSLEDLSTSHLIAQYKVLTTGNDAFSVTTTALRFISGQVQADLQIKLQQLAFTDLLTLLRTNNVKGSIGKTSSLPYESLVSNMPITPRVMGGEITTSILVEDLNRPGRFFYTTNLSSIWQPFRLELTELRMETPSYDTMAVDVLYYPTTQNFPLVDLIYKKANGNLVGIQVTAKAAGTRIIDDSAVKRFYENINLDSTTAMTYIYLPLPHVANKTKIEYSGEFPIIFQVLKLPENLHNDNVAESIVGMNTMMANPNPNPEKEDDEEEEVVETEKDK